jgi:tRNA A-37 threonylcarbamoyl transferase component Bud32
MTEEAPRVQCPVCKQILAPGVRFCPHDGTPLTETSARGETPTPTGARPPSRQIALPVVVGNRYRLVALRGGGGMAKVYKAADLTLGRDVAVKLINPELRAEKEFDSRFQREARIASQLSDPHIVVVHDFGLDPEHGPYLVMEYLQGHSLREQLSSMGPLPLKTGLQLAAQLLLALIHAHEKNVVHRDIKPDNIFLLNQSGVRLHIRVLDFGIARIFRSDEPGNAETLTSPGAVLGTPRYMSPEQLAGQAVNARSDLYSAAIVIHEALSGQLPYVSGKTLCELCPEATPALQELLDHCLRPNPNERPSSVLEVYLQLQELGKASGVVLLPPGALDKLIAARRAENPTAASPPGPPVTTVRMARPRRPRLVVAGLLLLVALAGIASLLTLFATGPTPAPAAESLLGIKVGDPFSAAVDRLKLTHGPVYPWHTGGAKPQCLGHILEPDDLGVSDDDLERVEVRWSPDECVAVVGLGEEVRAVVIRKGHRGATGRGVTIGAAVGDLYRVYDDATPRTEVVPFSAEEGGGHGEVRRYDAPGVGFVIYKGHVHSITLYSGAARR